MDGPMGFMMWRLGRQLASVERRLARIEAKVAELHDRANAGRITKGAAQHRIESLEMKARELHGRHSSILGYLRKERVAAKKASE